MEAKLRELYCKFFAHFNKGSPVIQNPIRQLPLIQFFPNLREPLGSYSIPREFFH
jgi:hypothetical protein